MLLSDKCLEALIACTRPSHTMGVRARRKAAQEAVTAAAEELGFDPLAPPLPRFAAGEDEVSAAVLRVLKVPGIEKELEKHRARVAACRAAAERLAELSESSRAAPAASSSAGCTIRSWPARRPGRAPADAIAEHTKIDAELALVDGADLSDLGPGRGSRRCSWRPRCGRTCFRRSSSTSTLVVERLRMLTEDERSNSAASMTVRHSAGMLAPSSRRATSGRIATSIARCAPCATRSRSPTSISCRSTQELTVEQLETARAGR